MAKGWISIHRCIWENWTWKDKPFSKGQAWIDILLMVNYEKDKVYFRDSIYDVERGQKITSELKLADRWGWSRNKVRRFINDLEMEQMLIVKRDKRKTTIEVVNYSKYQDTNTTESTRESTTESTTESQQKDINNNINKDNKKNPPLKKEKRTFTDDDKEYLLAKYLSRQIAKRLEKPEKDEKTLQSWSADFNKMVRIDKLDIEEIKDVLVFSQGHKFWKNNIMSAGKFRKQYLTLLSTMRGDEE